MVRIAGLREGKFLLGLIVLSACGGSGSSSAERDTALPADATVAETEPTAQTAPSLETGVDQAALAAAVTPQVIQFMSVFLNAAIGFDGISLICCNPLSQNIHAH